MQFRPEKATEARFLVEALLLSFTSGLAIQLYLGYRDSPRGQEIILGHPAYVFYW